MKSHFKLPQWSLFLILCLLVIFITVSGSLIYTKVSYWLDPEAKYWLDIRQMQVVPYKQTSTRPLNLYLFYPDNTNDRIKTDNSPLPAVLMFHGGGWQGGHPSELEAYCLHFANQGYVAITASYRLRGRDGTTPFEAVDDAEAAYQYVLDHANQLNINPNQVIVLGGSAGGHLAFWVARRRVNKVIHPATLILMSAVLDTSPKGYGYEKLGDRYRELSPVVNVIPLLPPTLILHSRIDLVVPFEGVASFHQQLLKQKVPTQLYTQNLEHHGFYVLDASNDLPKAEFLSVIDQFIKKFI